MNEQIIASAKQRCEDKACEDEAESLSFPLIYPFTTENITGYINFFELENKSLLTVGSSGDQALNAILKGCKDVTILDVNPYTEYYFYLKYAVILQVSLKEFLKFFCYMNYPGIYERNEKVFNKETYSKIKDTLRSLNYNAYYFWEELFNTYKPYIIRKLFECDEERWQYLKNYSLYLNPKYYEELKNKLVNTTIEFITTDIYHANINRNYDNIWLSNILRYEEDLDYFKKQVVDVLNTHLNISGRMLIAYLYNTTPKSHYLPNLAKLYNLPNTLDTFKEYHTEYINFPGVHNLFLRNQDGIILYRKFN